MNQEKPHTVHVLLVEDTPEVLLTTKAQIASPGRTIVTAESGEEALRLLGQHDYALALLDIQLPGMDGFELAGRIRNRPATRHLPIIFLTGTRMDRVDVFEGYQAGAVDYLLRPVDKHVLKSKVAVFCELKLQKDLISQYVSAIETQNKELQRQLKEIKTLQGLIPICSNCKKVREDDGYWKQVEVYIMERSQAEFTHGICKDCAEELYGEYV